MIIDMDGVAHRVRRGKLVKIPEEWLGKIVTEKTKRERKVRSLMKKKSRRRSRRK